MRITRLENRTPFQAKVVINTNANKDIKFLQNKVLDVVRENKVGAVFETHQITVQNVTDKILKSLNEFKIKFTKGE